MSEENPAKKEKAIITKKIDEYLLQFYDIVSFIGMFFRELVSPPFEFQAITKQCFEIGVKSLPLISLTAFITGIVFTNQSRPSLAEFGATSWLPALIAIAIVRALAPLVTALISAGKVGSGIGAELSSMKVTEQIDAMEVSAINPFKYLVVSRVIATTLMIPILSMYNGFVALIGSYLNIQANEQTSIQTFFAQVFETVTFLDIFSSLLKAIVFGFTIGIVGCYKGYHAARGTEGVGKAANSSVVTSMFLIFIEEIIIVQIVNSMRIP